MMVLDTRGLNYTDSFRRVSSIISGDINNEIKEFIVLVETQEKSCLIKGFAEALLGCSASLEEQSNTLFVKISGSPERVLEV